MKISQFLLVIFLACTSLGGAAAGTTPTYGVPGIRALAVLDSIQKKDYQKYRKEINNIKKGVSTPEEIEFIRNLWSVSVDKFQEVDPTFLMSPMVRLDLADFLIQARKNGRINMSEEFEVYALKFTDDKDVEVSGKAIRVIGLASRKKDIVLLKSIFQMNDERFYSAAWAISYNCFSTRDDYEHLYSTIPQKDRRDYFEKTWLSLQSFKEDCR